MNELSRPTSDVSTIAAAYETDGYFLPYDVTTEREAAALRADFEAAEAELADDRQKLSMLRGYSGRLLPSFDRLIRHPRLLAVANKLLGPDLLVWGSGLFIKEPNTKSFVSWHQDLNYWGLNTDQEVTAWFALTPATVENGCMRFVPGSHLEPALRPHSPLHGDREKSHTLVAQVDDAVDNVRPVPIARGDITVHNERVLHGSGGNSSAGWRRAYIVAFRSVDTIREERKRGFTHSHNDAPDVKTSVGVDGQTR